VNGTKGAKHVVYNHGGSDVLMTVTEQDLEGIKLTLWQSIKHFLLVATGARTLSSAWRSFMELCFNQGGAFQHMTLMTINYYCCD
jgi:hypothetical protein